MDDPDSPVRLAMVGAGWAVDQIWAPALDGLPELEVTVVADPNPDARQHAVNVLGGAKAVAAADELSPEDADLAVVATPNYLHGPVTASLLSRGIPVFVEKPVCLRPDEAAEIAAAERAGGTRLLAGTAAWHRADVQALRELAGELGEPRSMELTWTRASGVPARGSWFTDRSRAGGGALVDLGWHMLTVGLRLLGWPTVEEVIGAVSGDFMDSGASGADWHEATGDTGASVDVEDTARAAFRTESGVLCSLIVAWASPTETDCTRIVVEGSKGRAELTCTFGLSPNRVSQPRLVVRRAGRSEEVDLPAEPPGTEYRTQIKHLPALLRDPEPPGATPDPEAAPETDAVHEAAQVVDLVGRIYQSAGVGPPVPHPEAAGATTRKPDEASEGAQP
jgi:oxidoreductase